MEGRIEKSKRNMIYGVISTVVTLGLTFLTRTIFIYTLGLEYLGLNGLFTNILNILSLAEMGLGTAISFSLYNPLANKDDKKIASYIFLYRKSYILVGVFVSILSVLFFPFLDVFVNFDKAIDINYKIIYLLFVINTVMPYFFFTYKISIFYADQKSYIISKYEIIANIINIFLQMLILLFLKNYYIYLCSSIIVNLIKNYFLSLLVNKEYPYINEKVNTLTPADKKNLIKNIYSIFLTKVSGVVYSSTDSLIVSSFINTLVVGLMSNYTMITNMLKTLIATVFNSFTASIGNLYAEAKKESLYINFKRLCFLNYWLYAVFFICTHTLINNFICLWVGKRAVFGDLTTFLILLVFLIPGLNNVVNIYKDACGLYWQTRYRTLATAVVNLFSSLVLVRYIGVDGVFLGTIIAYIFTIYLKDPVVVYRYCFNENISTYYFDLIKKVCLLFIIDFFMINFYAFLSFYMSGWILFIVGGIIIFILTNVILFLFFCKNAEFKFYLNMIKNRR